jgi:hypothetical protein
MTHRKTGNPEKWPSAPSKQRSRGSPRCGFLDVLDKPPLVGGFFIFGTKINQWRHATARRRGRQPVMACIKTAVLIVAKFENVSETA